MVFVGKDNVILGSVVRLVCQYKVIPKDTGGRTDGSTTKDKGRTGGSTALRCVWFGKIRVSG